MKLFWFVGGIWFWFILAFVQHAALDYSVEDSIDNEANDSKKNSTNDRVNNSANSSVDYSEKDPTVFIAILARNKRHILPYFLTLLSKIDYPKNRIMLWIRTDHNVDKTKEVLDDWISQEKQQYHRVDFEFGDENEEYDVVEWTESRLSHMIRLREDALDDSRYSWADYAWILDCDALITDPSTLRRLMSYGHTIIAPMLIADQIYSNFWCGMNKFYYYERTNDYQKILHYQNVGCHKVPMVHSAVLINLKRFLSDKLTYVPSKLGPDYDGPVDDIIVFAVSAARAGIPLYICNDKIYGFITHPLEKDESLQDDEIRLFDMKIQAYDYGYPLYVNNEIFHKYTQSNRKTSIINLDKIFVINLLRRPEKRQRMNYILNELGLEATFIDAVDGSMLQDSDLRKMGIVPLPQYEDPYHKRPMKKGEIGCFLSHMAVWKQILENEHENVLVLEDDIKVFGDFNFNLELILKELSSVDWNLVYLGRKIMNPHMESPIKGTHLLVYPEYSYWTLAYLLSLEGARKLVNAKPLEKLIPVDEFLPVMYNKHPRTDWASYFPDRNLIALSADPLIVHPMKYLYEDGYISDTEDSSIINKTVIIEENNLVKYEL